VLSAEEGVYVINDIFTAVQSALTGFFTAISAGIQSSVEIFYGGTPAALTPAGQLAVIGLGFALGAFALGFVFRLLKVRSR
jgi:hypothetical protein